MLPLIVTSAQNALWQNGTVTPVTSGNATLTVTPTSTFQKFSGFGGAFNELGWKYLQTLSTSDQQKAMTLLFDPTNGANFQYGRIPIGASDYATTRYTDNENSGDNSMSKFSISQDQMFLIPYVKAALAVNPNLFLWGSAWTPPTWMKTSSGMVNSSLSCAATNGDTSPFDGGCMKSDAQTLTAYALYLSKWVSAYGTAGMNVKMIVPQNEPSYSQNYPSCLWDPPVLDTFIKTYLSTQLNSANPGTQIFMGTMSKGNATPGDNEQLAAIFADNTTKGIIKGVGLQWTMQSNGTFSFSSNGTTMNGVDALPNIWQTEHQAGNYPWNPAGAPAFNANMAPNDYPYGVESWGLITNWLKAGATSYSAWNMVLDTVGLGNDSVRKWPQDSLLVVNTSAKTLTATPAYYVFRHVSQYVQPGATRVATSGSLDSVAFRNPDGTTVTVMHNAGTSAAQTILAVGNTKLQFTVPANGFATVVN
jgi:glucosylceramidase